MIARIWHGCVPVVKAPAYAEIVCSRYIPDIRSMHGNRGVLVLQRQEDLFTHFLIISYWEDLAAIRSFAGDDIEVAKYHPEDSEYLIDFETHVQHFEVLDFPLSSSPIFDSP